MQDRRLEARLPVRLAARYHSPAMTMSAWVADVSTGGIFLRSDYLESRGSRVELTIDLPEKVAAVRVTGEVVRVDRRPGAGGMGIRFVDLPPQSWLQLSNFMIQNGYPADSRG